MKLPMKTMATYKSEEWESKMQTSPRKEELWSMSSTETMSIYDAASSYYYLPLQLAATYRELGGRLVAFTKMLNKMRHS